MDLFDKGTQRKAAGLAGCLYVLAMSVAVFSAVLMGVKSVVPEQTLQHFGNMVSSGALYCVSLGMELINYTSVVLLSLTF